MAEVSGNPNLMKALACKLNESPEQRFAIPVMNHEGKHIGALVCVDRGLATDVEIVSDLTAWRQRYMRYFLTQFEATVPRTRAWLEDIIIPSSDRILFVIFLTSGEAIGNFGICNMTASSGELDNLIRGRKGGDPRFIFYCELALLSWMFGHLDYRRSNLHVFSNNQPTIKLHSSVGFSALKSIRLTQRKLPDLTEYLLNSEKGESVDFSYLEMGIDRDTLLDLHPWLRSVYPDYWQSLPRHQQS